MKTKIFPTLLLCLLMSACTKDFLTKDHPTGTTDEFFWKTETQIRTSLAELYAGIPTGQFDYQPNPRVIFTGMTDDATWTANFMGEVYTFGLGNGLADMPQSQYANAIQPLWTRNYSLIRHASRFLEHAGEAYIDEKQKKQYIAEARTLRAWFHLDLMLYYGEIPIVTTAVTPNNASLVKNTRAEVLNFIITELDQAAPDLPEEYSEVERYRISKGANYTFKTVALLNNGKYAEAAVAAKKVIDLNKYELYNSYANLFTYAGMQNKERILMKIRGNHEAFGRSSPASVGGTSTLNPTAALVNEYETKQGKTLTELGIDSVNIYKKNPNYHNNRDPRLNVTILYNGVDFFGTISPFNNTPSNPNRIGALYSSRTGFWMRKYVDNSDRNRPYEGDLDHMVFRYADVLLMYVEALVESGKWNDPDVAKYLNMVRNRAKMPNVNLTVYNSQEKMRTLYQRERRVELALEGHRLFDIRRWRIADKVMNGPVYGATNPNNGETVIAETRTFSNKDWLWPIPAREIQGNPKMIQNDGY